MKKLIWGFLIVFGIIAGFWAGSAQTAKAQNQNKTQCVYYFYGSTCPHCAKVKPFLEKLEQKYPKLKIKRYEVYGSRENAELWQKFFEYYQVPQEERGVPIVFVGDEYLVGDTPIISMLEEYFVTSDEIKCVSTDVVQGKQTVDKDQAEKEKKTSSLPLTTIIGAAIVDSINPCAIAVLLILLSSLLFLGNRRRALIAGISFISAIFIAYFFFGLGLLTFIKAADLSYWLYRIIGGLAIIIGLWNIKDYFWHHIGPNIEIPKSWRPKVKALLRGVTSPIGAFLIGFVVTLIELPCTGGPYIFALGIMAEKSTLQTVPTLLLYNLFFILPLVIILAVVYFGLASIEKAKKWQERNIRLLHLVAGIIMLILGAIVISGLI